MTHAATLSATLAAYRTAIAAHMASPATVDGSDSDAEQKSAETTFLPVLDVLSDWTAPASSLAEAIEALRFAAEEVHDFADSTAAPPMIAAALGYLERLAAPTMSEPLAELIAEIQRTGRAFTDAPDHDDAADVLWRPYASAVERLYRFRCETMEDVRAKADAILSARMLATDFFADDVLPIVRSFASEAAVMASEAFEADRLAA